METCCSNCFFFTEKRCQETGEWESYCGVTKDYAKEWDECPVRNEEI